MAKKKSTRKRGKKKTSTRKSHGTPRFPYTVVPGVLRNILRTIPTKPKPPKVNAETVVGWGASQAAGGNTQGAVGVLKKVGLLGSGGEPTALYTTFMTPGSGPAALGAKLKEVYQPFFDQSHAPFDEDDDALENLFNIHSGGEHRVIRAQIQTFKALCEYATFDEDFSTATGEQLTDGSENDSGPSSNALPPVRVDLHIHLPENKSARDYEAIIQDIGKYIYGRTSDGSS